MNRAKHWFNVSEKWGKKLEKNIKFNFFHRMVSELTGLSEKTRQDARVKNKNEKAFKNCLKLKPPVDLLNKWFMKYQETEE